MSTTLVRKTIRHAAPLRKHAPRVVPPLVNGDALTADEFLRRYEAMPEIKAELIDGIVYIMASPVHVLHHGDPDNVMQGCLFIYSTATPGIRASTNATTRLGPKYIPQPDLFMRYLPERSGRERQVDNKGYLNFPPELVVEIAATSESIDAHKKRDAYMKAGVQEYILWRTVSFGFDWWFLKDGAYHPIPADADGIMRSRVFPGLWLDPKAIFADDRARVIKVLERGLKSAEHKAFAKLVK